jgi:hypothetical protein
MIRCSTCRVSIVAYACGGWMLTLWAAVLNEFRDKFAYGLDYQ